MYSRREIWCSYDDLMWNLKTYKGDDMNADVLTQKTSKFTLNKIIAYMLS